MRIAPWLLMLVLSCSVSVQAATLDEQRDWFQQADKALDRGDEKAFRQLRAKLNAYPLTPYLDIWHARKQLKKDRDSEAASVVKLHDDIPEVINLRVAWIGSLARRGKWSSVAHRFAQEPADQRRLPETYMVSQSHNNHKVEALKSYSERWIKGKRNSPMSDRLYHLWKSQGHPTVEERWQRIIRLADRGKWKSVKKVAVDLPKSEQVWVDFWRGMQGDPAARLSALPKQVRPEIAAAMINDGIVRLSRKDEQQAMKLLRSMQSRWSDNMSGFYRLQRKVALRAARSHEQVAAEWLAELPQSVQNEDTRGWRTRLYLLAANWKAANSAIAAMPQKEQQEGNWLYWRARSLDELGLHAEAESYYRKLAAERGYHSFLAAERLGLPPMLASIEPNATPESMARLLKMPCVHRAYEWLHMGKGAKASREWHYGLSHSSAEIWKAAMLLASSWDWHGEVIRAAYKSGQHDALEERFPLGFSEAVAEGAKSSGLSTTEIWSIIRQESAFNDQAVSYVGARGLMQLMPATAKQVAKQLKMKSLRPALFSPEVNVRLGATYLADQKERFGNLALAAAAYNAGPHRVSRWLKHTPYDRPEAWVEAIPYNETRRYVQRVLSYVTIYEWRQQLSPSSLLTRVRDREQKVSAN